MKKFLNRCKNEVDFLFRKTFYIFLGLSLLSMVLVAFNGINNPIVFTPQFIGTSIYILGLIHNIRISKKKAYNNNNN